MSTARGVAFTALLLTSCGGDGTGADAAAGAGGTSSNSPIAGNAGLPGSSGRGITPADEQGADPSTGGTGVGGVSAGGGGATVAGNGGSGGSGGSAPVDLPAGVTGLFPLPGAKGVCADPALRLSFASAPKLGSGGKLQVFDVASPAEAALTVDFAAMSVTQVVGGQTFNQARPVFVDGSDVVVPLLSQALGYGKQYYVTVEAGAIVPASGSFSITEPGDWRFSTHATAPSGSALSVALDGSGQFCSWQGALDAVPPNNTAPVTIDIQSGLYHGLVYLSNKQAITLRGQDRKKTILSGVNNNVLNAGTRVRTLFGADGASGLTIENLTIQNLTPQGGSQAEALRLQKCDKCVVRKTDVTSLQDTLLWSGRIYAEDCYIAGNVDFIWGDGAVYFNRCEIKNVGRSGYILQSRNGAESYGYVFVDSKLTSDEGITGTTLARVDVSEYPDSNVAFVGCTLGSHISKAGWTITGGTAPSSLRFWEYQSKTESGAALDVSGRVAGKQISAEQAAQLRDPKVVLGGWQPSP